MKPTAIKSLNLVLDCANAAFEDDEELPRILRQFANDISNGDIHSGMALYDINGNRVGRAYFSEKDDG